MNNFLIFNKLILQILICIFELLEKNFKVLNTKLHNDCDNNNLLEFLFDCRLKSNIKCLVTNEIFETNENDKILSLPIPERENVISELFK